tara:strand:+ start:2169 stop:2294 length:126 start_codon:yes stop_codon:yes gene_type:complete
VAGWKLSSTGLMIVALIAAETLEFARLKDRKILLDKFSLPQ